MERLVSIADFEREAKLRLNKGAFDYYSAGANAMVSLRECQEVFGKIKLKPKAFADPTKFKSLETKIFG